jgi:hypothetical protein
VGRAVHVATDSPVQTSVLLPESAASGDMGYCRSKRSGEPNIGGLVGSALAGPIGKWLTPGPAIMCGSALRSGGLACLTLAIVVPAAAIPLVLQW